MEQYSDISAEGQARANASFNYENWVNSLSHDELKQKCDLSDSEIKLGRITDQDMRDFLLIEP